MSEQIQFEKMCAPGKCEVCGKQTQVVVVASQIGPISNAICKDCLNKDLEPIGNIAAYLTIGSIDSYEKLMKFKNILTFTEAQMQARNATDDDWNDLWETVQRSYQMLD